MPAGGRVRSRFVRVMAALGLAAACALWGCGGSKPVPTTVPTPAATAERRRPANDGLQVSGIFGTIPPRSVEATLEPRVGRFMRCFEARTDQLAFLSGEIRMTFRVRVDGSVASVFPSHSSLGDLESERCVLEVARRARFPEPAGGEAEVTWGFAFDAPTDVRPPVELPENALTDALPDGEPLLQSCGAEGVFQVTAYVAPGGRVVAAGGSPPDARSAPSLDCILEKIRTWELPDPGSYPAKVSFSLPD